MNEFPESHILTLAGPARLRGRIHGETMRAKIQQLMGSWKDWLVQEGRGSSYQYCQDLVCETNFMNAIQKWTPDLLEEVKGIAEGAALDFSTIFAFQLQDEDWWFGQERMSAQPTQPRGCSSIGWKKDTRSPSIVAQNMDMPDFLDNYQVVMHIKDDRSEVESLVFSVCGLLALNGVNNHSLGVVCNNLSQLNHSKDGLPVAYVHRGVLEKRSFQEAESFLKNISHASGQNYMLGDPARVVDLECSANQVAEYSQPALSRSVCHTNHPFANTDLRSAPTGFNGDDPEGGISIGSVDSRTRFDVLYHQLEGIDSYVESNLVATKRLLRSHDSVSHPVCRHPAPGLSWMTLGTSIMILEEHPQLHVCPGPPCTSRFTQFSFN
jgi:predicted choloylglycine hydrolase